MSTSTAGGRTTNWTIIVRWEQPDPGVAAYGPYATREIAEADLARVEEDFRVVSDEPELPEDVELTLHQMGEGR